MDAKSLPAPPSTLGAELASGLLGAGVAIACVLPPIVHLVTGPLGPLIGGFVAANRVRVGARGRAIIAVTVGTSVAGLMAVAATVLVGLAGRSQLPEWFPAQGTLTALLCGVWLYAAILATIGTAISDAFARKESRDG
jgi:protein-S-isoprenylcysteine O-methyltransferase Ste14